MTHFPPAILLLIIPLMTTQLQAQELQSILTAQDQRDAVALEAFMGSQDDAVRSRAVIASASVQDTALLPLLISLLDDPGPDVRLAAALALGQLTTVVTEAQRSLLSSALLKRISDETNEAVRVRIVEAIGKAGNAEALNMMLSAEETFSQPVRGEVALAVGRFGYRTLRSIDGTAFVAGGLSQNTGETWKNAYALMRIGVDSLLRPFLPEMKTTFRNADTDTRMFLAAALGATRLPDVVPPLAQAARMDNDWRVRVNATRALGVAGKADSVAVTTLLDLCHDVNEHVSLTVLASLRSVDTIASMRPALAGFLDRAGEEVSARQRGEAARTIASLYGTSSATLLDDAYAGEIITGEVYAECLGTFDDPGSFEKVRDLALSTNVPVSRAALNALDAIVRRNPDPHKRQVARDAFLSSLRSNDMTLIVTGASAIGDTLYADSTAEVTLLYRLKTLLLPRDEEAIVAIIQALGALKSTPAVSPLEALLNSANPVVATEAAKSLDVITGKSYAASLPHRPPVHTDYDWDFLEGLKDATVEVRTSAGTFSFVLLTDEAPFTCMNFARLIDAGFYDGLLFHRVVPNFVIQGGDPRGDGWGGPGYSIRSEFGLQHYEAGMVGVASSGKDTEGSQFFVTHSRQPHLDGRYTIFGKIVSGMEVVDKIQVGDTIEKMRMIGRRNAERETRK